MKKKYYVGVSGHEIMKVNPFVSNLFEMEINTRTKVVAGNKEAINNIIVDKKTGDVIGSQLLAVKQKVDPEQFTKIFHKGLAAMWGLTSCGIKVFSYIASEVRPNKDFVYIELNEAKKFCKYKTDKSIWNGLGELLDASFIARTDVYYKYFINPTFFFNGNRLTLVNHYEVDPNLKPDQEQEERIESMQINLKLPPTE